MRDDRHEARLRRLLEEVVEEEAAGRGDDAAADRRTDPHAATTLGPQDERLYRLVFEALEEEEYVPIRGLAAAVEARLEAEGLPRGRTPRRVRSIGEPIVIAVVAAASGAVALPALLTPLVTLADALGRHWASANLDLLAAAAVTATLLALADRAWGRPGPRA